MNLTIRFSGKSWFFTVISLVWSSRKFSFNLLELDLASKVEPISLISILSNSNYTRIEILNYSKTI